MEKFRKDCIWVRDGCNFDISKIFKDGKPLIIDGTHVDPDCYLSSSLNEETGKYEHRIKTDLIPEESIGQEDDKGLDRGALLAMQKKLLTYD